MSGESTDHVRLVEALIAVVQKRHCIARGIVILADHHRFGADRPPLLGGFTPDVFACDVPATFRVVGEAKTPGDLESDRSLRQLTAFLDHLSLYPNSTFYLAVPWFLAPRARFVLKSLRHSEHARVVAEILSCT